LFPEFLQSEANADNLAEASLLLLRDKGERTRILDGLELVTSRLGQSGAAARAAQAVLGTLD
jgi:lipid A disaccharide synthetase